MLAETKLNSRKHAVFSVTVWDSLWMQRILLFRLSTLWMISWSSTHSRKSCITYHAFYLWTISRWSYKVSLVIRLLLWWWKTNIFWNFNSAFLSFPGAFIDIILSVYRSCSFSIIKTPITWSLKFSVLSLVLVRQSN